MSEKLDPKVFAPNVDTEAQSYRAFTVEGGDWSDVAEEAARLGEERIVVNMGPQHPSTHGVLRLILEIDGEKVTEARCGIGYLHTGIEKNMEFRTWTQGVTFCTRMDYLAPFFQEVAYCLGVERLLGIADDVPERAQVIRVMLMELNRVASHLVALATGGMELGATTVMTVGFRERETILRIFELITGLRMNHAFVRPGGLAQDIPPGTLDMVRDALPELRRGLKELEDLLNENPVVKARLVDVGHLSLAGCIALGITGPVLRSTGLPHDLRKSQPYCGYETYDFDVPTRDTADAYGRMRIRIDEAYESLKIVAQCVERLEAMGPGSVMVADKKVAWPAQLAIGSDGMGNSLEHIRDIMGQSMEALIHHFKLVTEGFRVPAGQVYQAVEHPRGELGVHLVSDGGTRPYRAHFRDPSFTNLQAMSAMCEGGQVADVVVAVASLDPVMGGGGPLMAYDAKTLAQLTADAEEIIARYPQRRSALLPLLHLVQSVDGYVSPAGIEFCADTVGLSVPEVSAVATFYTQYKRKPNGKYTVGVCTNTLCAIMGGDEIFDQLSEHLDVGHDETTPDGAITLERVECNAACDYAPVVMVNWEFFDNQTPQSAKEVVDRLREGKDVAPTRGSAKVSDFKETARILAGFNDGRANEGVAGGEPTLVGLKLAKERGWHAPEIADSAPGTAAQTGTGGPTSAPKPGGEHSSVDTPSAPEDGGEREADK